MIETDKINFRRLLRKWVALSVGLLLVCGALAIGLIAQNHATNIARCINLNLGQRAAPTRLDNEAHIAFARAIDALFTIQKGQEQAAQVLLQSQVDAYVTALVADQKVRDAHPTGKCK